MKISNEDIIQSARRGRQKVDGQMHVEPWQGRQMVNSKWLNGKSVAVAASLIGFLAGFSLHANMATADSLEARVESQEPIANSQQPIANNLEIRHDTRKEAIAWRYGMTPSCKYRLCAIPYIRHVSSPSTRSLCWQKLTTILRQSRKPVRCSATKYHTSCWHPVGKNLASFSCLYHQKTVILQLILTKRQTEITHIRSI